MRLSVRVEIDVPLSPHFTETELAQRMADAAANALSDRGAIILHAASVRRRKS